MYVLRVTRILTSSLQPPKKPEWERKVFDEAIVRKWHGEACKYHDDIEDDYLSEEMFKHVGYNLIS